MSVVPAFLQKRPAAPRAPELDAEMMALIDTIRAGLIRDGHVQLHQFGSFRLKWGKPRRFVNPRTGEAGMTGPIPRVTFTPAKHLRELVEPMPKPARPLTEETEPVTPIRGTAPAVPRSESPPSRQGPVEPGPVPENDAVELDIAVTEAMQEKAAQKGVRAWQLALLAAVPLIILLLQADFSGRTGAGAVSTPVQPQETARVEAADPPEPGEPIQVVTDASAAPAPVQTDAPPEAAVEETIPEQSGPAVDSEANPATRATAPPSEESPLASTAPAAAGTAVATQTPTPPPEDILYMEPFVLEVEPGDSLWSLADEILGDPWLWPYIYRANRERLADPDFLTSGMSLVIPGLQREPDDLTASDSEHVAESYYHLYQHYKSVEWPDAYLYLVGVRRFNEEFLASRRDEIDPIDWERAASANIRLSMQWIQPRGFMPPSG